MQEGAAQEHQRHRVLPEAGGRCRLPTLRPLSSEAHRGSKDRLICLGGSGSTSSVGSHVLQRSFKHLLKCLPGAPERFQAPESPKGLDLSPKPALLPPILSWRSPTPASAGLQQLRLKTVGGLPPQGHSTGGLHASATLPHAPQDPGWEGLSLIHGASRGQSPDQSGSTPSPCRLLLEDPGAQAGLSTVLGTTHHFCTPAELLGQALVTSVSRPLCYNMVGAEGTW